MAKTDPLIRWETEAIRESAARRRSQPEADDLRSVRSHKKDAWVTLRDAHYATGLPIETLRKWARRRHVPSELRQTEFGERRVVDLAAVEERAQILGRTLQPVPLDRRETPAPGAAGQAPPVPTIVDLRDQVPPPSDDGEPATQTAVSAGAEFEAVVDAEDTDEPAEPGSPSAQAGATEGAGDAIDSAPPGTMIVPIAAWDRMLMQLGNLHQAGQQLAEARERAAKAETEATFLRERLAELRAQMDPPPEQPSPSLAATPENDETPENHETPEKLWRYLWRGWRNRRR